MILVLTDPIRDVLPRLLADAGTRDALTNLARAHRTGEHVVHGTTALLIRLAEARELPEDVRGTFRQIRQRHHEAAALRACVSHLCEIEPDDGDVREEGDDAQRRFRVPLSWFGDLGRAARARLVAEHANDARIYARAGEAHLSRNGPRGVQMRVETHGGGGSTTAEAFRDHARHAPTLCILDADFKWSAQEGAPVEGETAARVRRFAREVAGDAVCGVHVVPCREIENLFPAAVVRACLMREDSHRFVAQCELAADLGLFGGGPDVNRMDLKGGLCRRDWERLEGPRRRYLARLYECTRGSVPPPPRGFCDAERRCPDSDEAQCAKPCACVIFDGLGDAFLGRVTEMLALLSAQKVAEHLLVAGQPSEPLWAEVGRLVFSWGCAYPRARV